MRAAWAAAFLISTALTPAAFAEPPKITAPHPAEIDRNGVLILIRSTLLALQQANETGNYTVLRDLGAPDFQRANTAARLGEIFANLRGQNLDLSGVSVLDPQLTTLPEIEPNGLMHMAGFFPSVPVQINFDLLYAPVAGHWRLFGLSVKVGSSVPVAPPPPSPAAPPIKSEAHKPKRKLHGPRPATATNGDKTRSEDQAPKPGE